MVKYFDMNGFEIKTGDNIIYGKSSRYYPVKKGVVISIDEENIEVLGEGNKKTGLIHGGWSHERILVFGPDIIQAIFVKSTNEILFSRCKNDMVTSEDGKSSIDGGRSYVKITGDLDNIVKIQLNKSVLLDQILYYDWNFGNKNVQTEYINGYYGKFKIHSTSNLLFYNELVVNFEDIQDYF